MALKFDQFVKAVEEDRNRLANGDGLDETMKCGKCCVALQESVTGCRLTKDAAGLASYVCSDCYFDELGDFVDAHPIAMPRRRRFRVAVK